MPNTTVPAADAGLPSHHFDQGAHACARAADLASLIEAHRKADADYAAAARDDNKATDDLLDFIADLDFSRVCSGNWTFDHQNIHKSRAGLHERIDAVRTRVKDCVSLYFPNTQRRVLKPFEELIGERLDLFNALVDKVEAKQAGGDRLAQRRKDAFARADEILLEICAWPCASLEEMRAKGRYLAERSREIIEDDLIAALLRSLAGDAAAEG